MTKDDLHSMFSADVELIQNWHLMSGCPIDDCVEDTWSVIEDLELHMYDWGYFAIDTKKDVVPWLTGFFVYPEFRGKIDFWAEVDKHIGFSVFIAGVYNKNIPANKFLAKRGRVLRTNGTTSIYLIKRGL